MRKDQGGDAPCASLLRKPSLSTRSLRWTGCGTENLGHHCLYDPVPDTFLVGWACVIGFLLFFCRSLLFVASVSLEADFLSKNFDF